MPMGTKTVLRSPVAIPCQVELWVEFLLSLCNRGGRFLFQYGSVLEGNFFFCHWFLDTFFGGLLGLTSAYFMNNVFYSSYRDISDLQMVIIASSFLVLMSISTKVANFCRGHVISKSK